MSDKLALTLICRYEHEDDNLRSNNQQIQYLQFRYSKLVFVIHGVIFLNEKKNLKLRKKNFKVEKNFISRKKKSFTSSQNVQSRTMIICPS